MDSHTLDAFDRAFFSLLQAERSHRRSLQTEVAALRALLLEAVMSLSPALVDERIAADPRFLHTLDEAGWRELLAEARRRGQLQRLAREHHVAQLWIYAWLLKKAGMGYPRRMEITYMTMGDIHTVPAPLPTPEGRQFVEARIVAKAKAIVEADPALGPKGDPREEWQCRYCLYKAACPDRRKSEKKSGK